jgi:hypothetical protein
MIVLIPDAGPAGVPVAAKMSKSCDVKGVWFTDPFATKGVGA